MISANKISFLFLLIVLVSCKMNQDIDLNDNFINNYGNDNFSKFKNHLIFVRAYKDGNPSVDLFDLYDNRLSCRGPIIYLVDKDKYKVISAHSYNSDSCGFNIDSCSELAIRFVKYNILALKVDSNETVQISLHSLENGYDLMKFKYLKFKNSKYDKWIPIKNNWYRKPREGG